MDDGVSALEIYLSSLEKNPPHSPLHSSAVRQTDGSFTFGYLEEVRSRLLKHESPTIANIYREFRSEIATSGHRRDGNFLQTPCRLPRGRENPEDDNSSSSLLPTSFPLSAIDANRRGHFPRPPVPFFHIERSELDIGPPSLPPSPIRWLLRRRCRFCACWDNDAGHKYHLARRRRPFALLRYQQKPAERELHIRSN